MVPVFHVLAKKNHALLCEVVDTSSKIRSVVKSTSSFRFRSNKIRCFLVKSLSSDPTKRETSWRKVPQIEILSPMVARNL